MVKLLITVEDDADGSVSLEAAIESGFEPDSAATGATFHVAAIVKLFHEGELTRRAENIASGLDAEPERPLNAPA